MAEPSPLLYTNTMTFITTGIQQVVYDLFGIDQAIELTRPEPQFGDYTTNVALQISKTVGQNPRQIAEQLVAALSQTLAQHVQTVSVAGPGFINMTLTDAALVQAMQAPGQKPYAGQKILVEYSDPNPLKPLHAGHLYTTLVGDSIARLIVHAGAETVRINYGGDVGRHIGISMWAIIREIGGELPDALQQIPATERPAWLGQRYVAGTAAFEDDEAAKTEIIECNKRVYELHAVDDHESPFARIYWTVRQWSYDYFQTLYDQLQVTPFDRYIPESEVTPLGVSTVQAHIGDVFSKSDGAIIFKGEDHGLHTRVFINSAGLPTYETKDVGLSLTKWQDYTFNHSIIITANEQSQYMQVVLAAISQFAPEPAQRTQHITHGTVKLQGGVKMSSRKGNIVTALDILRAAREAGAASGTNPSEDTMLAAVKYAFAKNRVGGDIVYDPKESIALEGNSGPYLQYAHARARSILRKVSDERPTTITDITPNERLLVRKLGMFNETITLATDERMPHHICSYLYELAQTFNRFYERNRVIDDARQSQRLYLLEHYAQTLAVGLDLLGITAPERM